MSDKMTPLTTKQLLNWIVAEFINNRSIFGINERNFFNPIIEPKTKMFGHSLDTIVGPAAGPHTQMSQNIIASYLTGGRFIELKTVQILDELEIDKPCIDAGDECYNIEWSQELKLNQSYSEYIKAWVLLHFIKRLLNLSNANDSGFIFNMSVGYDLKGIQSEPIDKFIAEMMDGSINPLLIETIDELQKFISLDEVSSELLMINDRFNYIGILNDIPPFITNSITLSTMHGCPPDEIEAIAKHLLSEKKLHTYVKLNPTLLGFEFVNDTLHRLGYNYLSVGENVFEKDLKMSDAVPMIKRLQKVAADNDLEFGVKLSNTLPVDNEKPNLDAEEMYMSGRSLFPFTINLASTLADELNGDINISYSGGATSENIESLIQCGVKPITVATDLLKPGGYGRLKQMAERIEKTEIPSSIDSNRLKELADDSLINKNYRKEKREVASIKIPSSLPLFDCYIAPCTEACPIHQDVPEYINLIQAGKYEDALNVITSKNPLPHITGYICDHQCMFHCTRWDYDDPVAIRDLKKEAALKGFNNFLEKYQFPAEPLKDAVKAAIIGAGPAGLSSAYFLTKAGIDVTVFEKEMNAGGIVKNIIPHFRLPDEAIEKNIQFIERHGVRFVFGCEYNFDLEQLKKEGYQYIVLAIGAGISNTIELNKTNAHVIDAIDFLWEFHHDGDTNIGKNVAVIGGGNSAMDGARAAYRCQAVENVYLIYRRTAEFMPADMEEFYAALEDGVQYKELLQPINLENGILRCQKMQLDDYDSDGRRKVKPIENEYLDFEVDTVISAIGEHADFDLLSKNNIVVEENSTYKRTDTFETNLYNVFICGDASDGPATVVEAIADAKKVSNEIIKREKLESGKTEKFDSPATESLIEKKSLVISGQSADMSFEADRCLMCSYECNKCVDVCPNRANVVVKVEGNGFKDTYQIVHIDSLCNECGNCETFCPHQGSPYKDKLTYFSNAEEFVSCNLNGFYVDGDSISVRSTNEVAEISLKDSNKDQTTNVIQSFLRSYEFLNEH